VTFFGLGNTIFDPKTGLQAVRNRVAGALGPGFDPKICGSVVWMTREDVWSARSTRWAHEIDDLEPFRLVLVPFVVILACFGLFGEWILLTRQWSVVGACFEFQKLKCVKITKNVYGQFGFEVWVHFGPHFFGF